MSHQRSDPWRMLLASNHSEDSVGMWGVRGNDSHLFFGRMARPLTKPLPKGLKRQAGLEGGIPFTPLSWARSQSVSVSVTGWQEGRSS